MLKDFRSKRPFSTWLMQELKSGAPRVSKGQQLGYDLRRNSVREGFRAFLFGGSFYFATIRWTGFCPLQAIHGCRMFVIAIRNL